MGFPPAWSFTAFLFRCSLFVGISYYLQQLKFSFLVAFMVCFRSPIVHVYCEESTLMHLSEYSVSPSWVEILYIMSCFKLFSYFLFIISCCHQIILVICPQSDVTKLDWPFKLFSHKCNLAFKAYKWFSTCHELSIFSLAVNSLW